MNHLKNSSFAAVLLVLLAACSGGGDSSSDVSGSKDYINAQDVVIPGNNTQATLHINANCNWTIKEDIEWLSANPQQGSGSQNVTLVTTGINPSSTVERTGTIIITNNGSAEHRVTVTQQKASEVLEANVSTLTFAESKSYQDITITSNNEWRITGQTEWLYLNRYEGSGNASVRVNVEANESSATREADLRITSNSGLYATVKVKQTGKSATLSLTPDNLSANPEGETKQLTVTCNGTWTATSSQSWARLDKTSGNGNATLTLTVERNESGATRTAIVTVTSGTLSSTCTLSQNAVEEENKPSEGDNPLPGI